MDPIRNPFSPGAGTPPPELAGRDELLSAARVAIARARAGRPAKSKILVGLRGVGKTVLLERIRLDAEREGAMTIFLEAQAERSLPALLAPQLRLALLRLSQLDSARALAVRGLRALAGFAKRLKINFADIEVGVDFEPEPGLADNGDFEQDLAVLTSQIGEAAKAAQTVLVILFDELQYVPSAQLAPLISALHRSEQLCLPLVLVGAGLPSLRAQMGNARTYAERLFDFPMVDALSPEFGRLAVVKPLNAQAVDITQEAIEQILEQTRGYPYFLQLWASYAWLAAEHSPIDMACIQRASAAAIAALDESFFRLRFDRLTERERLYLQTMAIMGPAPHRSGDIAAQLGVDVSKLAPIRSALIAKGMIWSPSHGLTAFTVPMFDEFMLRILPKGP